MRALLAGSMLLGFTGAAAAQAGDTTNVRQLDALVVTAERATTRVAWSTGAVSVLTAEQLRAQPVHTLADALRQVPGMAFIDFDGLGFDAQAMVRGFYGGGEAEYVLVLLDGRPVNDFETGRVDWDLIPVSAIESIEVVRGGASPVWGDAAMGGVVNVITKEGARGGHAAISAGEYGVRAAGTLRDSWADIPVSVFGDVSRSDGYRAHAERRTGTLGARLALYETPNRALALSTVNDWRDFDEPGALPEPLLGDSREASTPFYRFDHADVQRHNVGIEGGMSGPRHVANAGLSLDYRRSDRTRTLPLAPTFADTKNRQLTTTRLMGSAQLEVLDVLGSGMDRLLLGVDATYGRLTSEYADVFQGAQEDYASGTPGGGPVTERGNATRSSAAAFARLALTMSDALRITAGARLDALRDAFDAEPPSEPQERSASHVAFSPSVGANLRFMDSPRQRGHVYATVGRSFKAPTLDQLFDQRAVPVPFPPFRITFANDELEPQYGTSVEAGVYHHADLAPGILAADLTLSAYQIDLRDELDFDLETLRYQNIGRSRHRGLEAGLQLRSVASIRAFVNYALQAATAREGENAGRQLKAIPRHFVTAGASVGRGDGPGGGVTFTTAREMPLDDANTQNLPDWTRWDARVSYRLRGFELVLDVTNLLDATYSTTGFPDPAGSDLVYFHPAVGRTFEFGLRRDW